MNLKVQRRAPLLALGGLLVVAAAAALVYIGGAIRPTEKKRPAGAPPVPVSVAVATGRTVPVYLRAIGNVDAYSSVAVKARVDGQIVEVGFREGQAVRRDEVLFRLDARPFVAALRQAEANVARDTASRDQARSQERRYLDLLEKNFVSKEAYAQFRTNAETAEAQLKASQAALETARLNFEYCTIRSPIDGFVGRIMLQLGNLVKANDTNPLVVINQVKPVYVTFAVPEQGLAQLRQHMAKGPLEVDASSSDAASAPIARGRLVFIDNAVDTSTGTIKLRAQFDNTDLALWPGQFIAVKVKLYDQKDAVVVPSAAVQTGPQGEYVYVLTADSTIEVRRVTVARTEGEETIIAKGVTPREKVVTRGQLRLQPNSKVIVRPDAS
ncbi:MAG TPA: efflux RND transporter periplasmic adaptor subunit [Burkholderiales bacterium]|nr:efflux RND transporter periplasmic adaptor subunit [Burkholderiales bacterium]